MNQNDSVTKTGIEQRRVALFAFWRSASSAANILPIVTPCTQKSENKLLTTGAKLNSPVKLNQFSHTLGFNLKLQVLPCFKRQAFSPFYSARLCEPTTKSK